MLPVETPVLARRATDAPSLSQTPLNMSIRRQDYILRVKYHNPLPPPPFPPRLVDIPNPVRQYADPSFVSNLAQEKAIDFGLEPEMGMPLDLSSVMGAFEGDSSAMLANQSVTRLDPKDRVLLKIAGGSGSSQIDVPFLRRTEYISSMIPRSASSSSGSLRNVAPTGKALAEHRGRELRDVDRQLKAIDETFAAVQQPIESLKHPTKPNVHAVNTWNLLPNEELIEQSLQHILVRVADDLTERSHSVNATQATQTSNQLSSRHEVALFMPSSSNGEEYLSYFLPNDDTAERMKRKIYHPEEAGADADEAPFTFTRSRNFDASMHVNASGFEDVCIVFNRNATDALYSPLFARSTLKRRRMRGQEDEEAIGAIELRLANVEDDQAGEKETAEEPAGEQQASEESTKDVSATADAAVETKTTVASATTAATSSEGSAAASAAATESSAVPAPASPDLEGALDDIPEE
ncbi:RNA polymerase II associated Paf1 complex [Schizosaccharomyces japonicus yFS275]|uniref:RNA polymerase II associated Paf1 complex n=1 Tax=Schizosaccharomyces japonicus (strain yFS275 / FY16936) TaxID=402676 RepID=B6JYE9_SCHJY|nr:RNA polymerase II associated Paf1 complex [Schizosaccharomyces japonicus yFS275]EEB06567.1 RNA polymerase II associated Paf1 complex [Schizosaccharomyces japonicus yFS275]